MSAEALIDNTETATDRYKYRAFGLQQLHTGTSQNPFTFVGKQGYYKDAELDLYLLGTGSHTDNGGRFYDPAVGRFLSEDPLGYKAQDETNLYRYVYNNPVNLTDPSGQDCFSQNAIPPLESVCNKEKLPKINPSIFEIPKAVCGSPKPTPQPSLFGGLGGKLRDARDCCGLIGSKFKNFPLLLPGIVSSLINNQPLPSVFRDVGKLLGVEYPKGERVSKQVCFILESLDNPCLRASPGFDRIAGTAREYKQGFVQLLYGIEDVYYNTDKYIEGLKTFFGQLWEGLKTCLGAVWQKVQNKVKSWVSSAGQVFKVMMDMIAETLSAAVDTTFNTSWEEWWKLFKDGIKEAVIPIKTISKHFSQIIDTTKESVAKFWELSLAQAGDKLRKMLESIVGILDSIGLYIYLLSITIPSVIGSIFPGPGTAAGASVGMSINTGYSLALTFVGNALKGLDAVLDFFSLKNLIQKKLDTEEIDEENEPCEIPDIVFTKDELKEVIGYTINIVSTSFEFAVTLAMAVAGSAAKKGGQDAAKKVIPKPKEGGGGTALDKIKDIIIARCATCTCFPAGTLVSTAEGLKPIETIRAGERVWGRDERTGEWLLCPVIQPLHQGYEGDLVTLVAGGETIVVTGGHPFWVHSGEDLAHRPLIKELDCRISAGKVPGRWVDSRDLKAGDLLVSKHRLVTVEDVNSYEGVIPVYNLHVAVIHTYTVAGSALLVHNMSKSGKKRPENFVPPCTPKKKKKGKKGKRAPDRLHSPADKKRIADIRSKLGIGKKRNIAFGEGHINGKDFGEVLGVSGKNTPGVGMPANRIFTTGIDEFDRAFDAEVFVLENFASRLNPNDSGTLKLVSERLFCDSCSSVIEQFQERFPNINLILVDGSQ